MWRRIQVELVGRVPASGSRIQEFAASAEKMGIVPGKHKCKFVRQPFRTLKGAREAVTGERYRAGELNRAFSHWARRRRGAALSDAHASPGEQRS